MSNKEVEIVGDDKVSCICPHCNGYTRSRRIVASDSPYEAEFKCNNCNEYICVELEWADHPFLAGARMLS